MNQNPDFHQLIDQLFRHESGRMVSVLTRLMGPENLQLAEDVVQDAILEAMTHWTDKGIPDNPQAWLMKVAKNKALNILNRHKYRNRYLDEMTRSLNIETDSIPGVEFTDQEILDDQLRMMFTCCHPSISSDSQVALTLKTLCGFSIVEIAKGFLTSEENIHKRLVRARQKIRQNKIAFAIPEGQALVLRLDIVLKTIYLLFNEGYSASSGEDLIRHELCDEAIRLTELILVHPAIREKSEVYALLALMQLNASRFAARQGSDGGILTLEEQDRSLWDKELIHKGSENLAKSTAGIELSIYHILATISACHCGAPDYASTDWKSILSLYNHLLLLENSPIVQLNRAIALSKAEGPLSGLEALESIMNAPSLQSYHLLYSTKADFHLQLNQYEESASCLEQAILYSTIPAEKELLLKRLNDCRGRLMAE